ncbi:MAG: peptidylprolyl isomerase FKBP-type [Frankiales bacterium]|nr:peptidylprolyl isomerase FKBP-type [Frankiales bacterium]
MRRATAVLVLPLLAAGLLSGCGASANKASALPTVKGSYGSKPTFAFPSKTPPKTLMSKVLRQGTGPVVGKGDLLVADYLGQVWGGAVFDNSYDRKAAAGFAIGVGKVIPGWDSVLVGVKAGSRVIMSIPPAQGYGTAGNTQAGIKGTDTLVFVVDVVSSYNKSVAGDPAAAVQKGTTPGITVKGALGAAPTVTVAKGTKAPTKPLVTMLARGTGPAVKPGLLVVQYAATAYNGTVAGSTWTNGAPAAVTVPVSGTTTAFDVVRGLPLGSRVLLRIPGSSGQPGVAVALDLVAQPKTAAETG